MYFYLFIYFKSTEKISIKPELKQYFLTRALTTHAAFILKGRGAKEVASLINSGNFIGHITFAASRKHISCRSATAATFFHPDGGAGRN